MAKLHIHPVGLGLIFFGLLSWVVALGGLGATTSFCDANRPAGSGHGFCATSYQVEWWSIWFEFILLCIMLATVFINAFERARFIYLTYLSMATVLLTISARNFINSTFITGGLDLQTYKGTAYNAAAAGCILMCCCNYMLIAFVGVGAAGSIELNRPQTAEQRYSPLQLLISWKAC
ncbi:MAG: hypothetical protein WDW38_011290 [Sanguina aurantia]